MNGPLRVAKNSITVFLVSLSVCIHLPHVGRPPPGKLDIEGLQAGRITPEDLLKQSKKGQPMMMFAGVRGDPPDKARTERISSRWVASLMNAHLQADRYIVADDRVLLVIKDGSQTWDVKDYLITQTDCTTVSFEQQTFNCAIPEGEKEKDGSSDGKKESSSSNKKESSKKSEL